MNQLGGHPPLWPILCAGAEDHWPQAASLLSALGSAGIGAWYWEIATGRFYCTSLALQLFGLDEEPSRPTQYLDLVAPEDRNEVRLLFHNALNHAASLPITRHRIYSPDGDLQWLEVSGNREYIDEKQCLVGVLRNLTDHERQAVEALLEAGSKYVKAFQTSPNAILITERHSMRIIDANDGFYRMTGYHLEEIFGKVNREVGLEPTQPEEAETAAYLLQRDGFIRHLETSGRHRDGTLRRVEVTAEPIIVQNQKCLLFTIHDIGNLKTAQESIEHLAYHDSLTNLPNRALLMDRLIQQIALLQRHDLRGALLFLDLDNFKHI
ncbi:TPA: PAS domain S-box protein, partial [Pseudomonas aeruginosa]